MWSARMNSELYAPVADCSVTAKSLEQGLSAGHDDLSHLKIGGSPVVIGSRFVAVECWMGVMKGPNARLESDFEHGKGGVVTLEHRVMVQNDSFRFHGVFSRVRGATAGDPKSRKATSGSWRRSDGSRVCMGASSLFPGLGLRSRPFFGFLGTIAFSVDLDDFGSVDQSIHQGDGARSMGKDLVPVIEGLIGGDEDGSAQVVTTGHDFEQEVSVAGAVG